jgi:hypothetical protein
MWGAAERSASTAAQSSSPAWASGNFAGMMPDELRGSSIYQGVEMDGVTAAIAKALYPKHGVTRPTSRQYDAPRTPTARHRQPALLRDRRQGGPGLPHARAGAARLLLRQELDAVQPGGALLFVTSTGTMNKLDTKAREYLAERAWLAGAIRLPGGAFAENAGTEVTTDIVALVKKVPGEERPSWAAPDSWVETVNSRIFRTRKAAPRRARSAATSSSIPRWCSASTGFFDRLWPGRIEVKSDGRDLTKALAEAMDRLPESDAPRRCTRRPRCARPTSTSRRRRTAPTT